MLFILFWSIIVAYIIRKPASAKIGPVSPFMKSPNVEARSGVVFFFLCSGSLIKKKN
jgi:hypothetical protein